MLFRTIHMPGLYSRIPADSANALSYCGHLIQALLDSEKNCVILVDQKGDISNEMAVGISRWPIKCRKRAEELLEKLKKRKRLFVIPSGGFSQSLICPCHPCMAACEISMTPDIYMILTKNECATCALMPRSVILEEYVVSTYNEERSKKERIELNEGEWSKFDFEDRVWKPLFRHTRKRVRLFDRFIGRTMKKEGSTFRLEARFESALDWMLEQFASFHCGKPKPSFEIHTAVGMYETDSAKNPVTAAQYLRDWAASRSAKYGCKIVMHVKKERIGSEMKKSRFVITDQIALFVSHGTDLLRKDGRIRGVEIFNSLEGDKIINDFFDRLAAI